jgi:hypothetical protein
MQFIIHFLPGGLTLPVAMDEVGTVLVLAIELAAGEGAAAGGGGADGTTAGGKVGHC